MVRTLINATAALALLASPVAFAAGAQQQTIGQPQLQTKAEAKQQTVAARHKDRDVVGDRETAALNSLEAAGYFTVKDMHSNGKNISVEAKKPGADFTRLIVRPDGTIDPAS